MYVCAAWFLGFLIVILLISAVALLRKGDFIGFLGCVFFIVVFSYMLGMLLNAPLDMEVLSVYPYPS